MRVTYSWGAGRGEESRLMVNAIRQRWHEVVPDKILRVPRVIIYQIQVLKLVALSLVSRWFERGLSHSFEPNETAPGETMFKFII